MINQLTENSPENVCDLKYLTDTMGGNRTLIKEIMEVFLKQIPEELHSINEAIEKRDYSTLKSFAHTMKSSVSIMGISALAPVLQEMESLSTGITHSGDHQIERITDLNKKLDLLCQQALKEIKNHKQNYI
jgi:HPt (histidine-containing phosphotransfer) domain-containing protein